ncbi:MAG: DUF4359 domain-containing protein [Spirulinaceae cyanobacterium]
MKPWQITATTTTLVLGVVGVGLAVTNPGPMSYQDYATEQLLVYLQENICTSLPSQLQQFSEQCRTQGSTLINTARPQLESILEQNTRRENYLFFSIYRTRFSLPPVVPAYEFETLGIFNQFYIYQAQQQ